MFGEGHGSCVSQIASELLWIFTSEKLQYMTFQLHFGSLHQVIHIHTVSQYIVIYAQMTSLFIL